jgi:hypothetical protein
MLFSKPEKLSKISYFHEKFLQAPDRYFIPMRPDWVTTDSAYHPLPNHLPQPLQAL